MTHRRPSHPLASVVVPVFNGERYLRQALESVCAQDYEPIEIVVVDDGSTDRTPAIARAFDRVRYVRQENQGPSAARNTGLELSSGEFIGFLDSDDEMRPSKVGFQVRYLLDHPEASCVMVGHSILIEPGVEMPAGLAPDPLYGMPGGIFPISALFRREALSKVGGFNPSFRHTEGMDLLMRLRQAGMTIETVPEVLFDRRLHDSNVSNRREAMQSSLFKALKSNIDRNKGGLEIKP